MDPKLVMFIFPSNRTDLYAAIKKRTCVDRAVASQVVLAKTIKGGKGGLMSIATKISIQLNCKLGGAPWMINMPPLSGLMTIGFDVCHDTRDKSKSYGALVASMDLKKNVEFFSAVSAHKNGEELSNTLVMNVNKALLNYRSLYGCLPQRILFYRDGVGDGQIEYVHSHEVELLKKKLNEIYADAGQADALKFCFIIVNKRLNTRLFNNGNNPGSGTIVDDVITLPERYDFYMISQTVRQGTVSPTSYNIISDNMGLPADKLQQLTYKFCHLYYNWSGTTRVPAVCQYAHKLAFLVGNYLHQAPSNALERKLYFL
jgi:aubergine-like protein